jgi:hypothetical protein
MQQDLVASGWTRCSRDRHDLFGLPSQEEPGDVDTKPHHIPVREVVPGDGLSIDRRAIATSVGDPPPICASLKETVQSTDGVGRQSHIRAIRAPYERATGA